MTSIDETLNPGDIITIAGLYADGSVANTPEEQTDKPLQYFFVGSEYRLHGMTTWGPLEPIFSDGTPDLDYTKRVTEWKLKRQTNNKK